ncbi:MAG: DUF1175 family protein [Acidobacteria bacterium]|nr:DUF1175 family protein [Acidobacteriota bacterium]
MAGRVAAVCAGAVFLVAVAAPVGQVRLADETDREAFRAWFTFLADAQFYRPTADVTDCAGLVRHAAREALRAHTPEWRRLAALPDDAPYPDVRSRPAGRPDGWPLFRVSERTYAEFADARTIIGLNARFLGRDVGALRPADLLYFRQDTQSSPDHVMVFVGPSRLERDGRDWIVYHTGPIDGGPGEVRKTRLADLMHHPVARWRPLPQNPSFVGVYRLGWL